MSSHLIIELELYEAGLASCMYRGWFCDETTPKMIPKRDLYTESLNLMKDFDSRHLWVENKMFLKVLDGLLPVRRPMMLIVALAEEKLRAGITEGKIEDFQVGPVCYDEEGNVEFWYANDGGYIPRTAWGTIMVEKSPAFYSVWKTREEAVEASEKLRTLDSAEDKFRWVSANGGWSYRNVESFEASAKPCFSMMYQ